VKSFILDHEGLKHQIESQPLYMFIRKYK